MMDNFSAHKCAVEQLQEEGYFENVEIVWLPLNMTAKYQPCDQGIIANFKVKYKKRWTRFIITEADNNRNVRKTMTIKFAVE